MSYFLGWRNRVRVAIAGNHNRAVLIGSVDCGSYFLKATKGLFCGMTPWVLPYGDDRNLRTNGTKEGRRRRRATAVMGHLEYLRLQRVTTVQHPILSSSFNISSQQEIHRAVGDTQDHRILILISIQRFRRVKNQGSDFSPSVKLSHSLRRRDHAIVG